MLRRIKFLGRDPDGRYRYERWVREAPSQSNSGGWVPEEWTEDGPLKGVEHDLHEGDGSHDEIRSE